MTEQELPSLRDLPRFKRWLVRTFGRRVVRRGETGMGKGLIVQRVYRGQEYAESVVIGHQDALRRYVERVEARRWRRFRRPLPR